MTLQFTKKGEVRKRKPKENNVYFTSQTEDAILEYLQEENPVIRDRIFNQYIHYALYKLVENIIHTFKFYHTDSTAIEDLKYEVVCMLLEKLHLFNHSKYVNDRFVKIIIKKYGEYYEIDSFCKVVNNAVRVEQSDIDEFIATLTLSPECRAEVSKLMPPKAFSYFGTIAKRYLINYNKKNYQRQKERVDLSNVDTDKTVTATLSESFKNAQDLLTQSKLDYLVEYLEDNMDNLFKKTRDREVVEAVLQVVKRREYIDLLSKKALYVYIREQVDYPTPVITTALKKIRDLYEVLNRRYLDEGIPFLDNAVFMENE
jgi:hypothetical protein